MIEILVLIAFAFMVLLVLVIQHILANLRLKRHQKEWNALKEMLIAFAPSISENELREAYLQYIESIECYYPRF